MYACAPHACLVLAETEEGIGSPGTGVTGCRLLSVWVPGSEPRRSARTASS